MRFKEFISEALDSKVDYKVMRATARMFRTRATIGSRDVVFTADTQGSGLWEVDFKEINDTDSTFQATGSGEELKVFAMVDASLKEFVARYAPEKIMFSAKEENAKNTREKVYTRLMTRLGYKLHSRSDTKTAVKILTFTK